MYMLSLYLSLREFILVSETGFKTNTYAYISATLSKQPSTGNFCFQKIDLLYFKSYIVAQTNYDRVRTHLSQGLSSRMTFNNQKALLTLPSPMFWECL